MGTKGRKTRRTAVALAFTAGTVAALTNTAQADEVEPQPPLPPDEGARVRQAAAAAERGQRVVRSRTIDAEADTSLGLAGGGESVGTVGTTESIAADGDSAHRATVIDELPHDGTRMSAVLDERPENDEITFDLELDDDILPWVAPSGQVILYRDGDVAGVVEAPWAVDSAGRDIATSLELRDGQLVQHLELDDPAIQYPVIADPTYWNICNCVTHGGFGSASSYVHGSIRPDKDFTQSRGYYPVWGENEGVTRVVRRSGECSWYPDTGPYWDFQIPCKMHDYCWDLIRASRDTPNYGKVSEGACDNEFLAAMDQHCAQRGFWTRSLCHAEADLVHAAVLPFSP